MSDDEDEGQLRIVENGDDSFEEMPRRSLPAAHVRASPHEIEEGEIEEGELNDTPAKSEHPHVKPSPSSSLSDISPPSAASSNNSKKKYHDEDGRHHRKRKEQKSGMSESSTTSSSTTSGRSKRTSHQLANAAIAAMMNEDDEVQMPEAKKKPKKDAATNVFSTSRYVEADDTTDANTVLEASAGATFMVEIKILCKPSENGIMISMFNDALVGSLIGGSIGNSAAVRKRVAAAVANGAEEGRERNSSTASTSHTPAKGYRSGQVNIRDAVQQLQKRGGPRSTTAESRRKVSSVVNREEEEDVDVQDAVVTSVREQQLVEIDEQTMHPCYYDGCDYKFFVATELEFHVAKFHLGKKATKQTTSCQTKPSTADASTDVADLEVKTPTSGPPILVKPGSPELSDISDDDVPPRQPPKIDDMKDGKVIHPVPSRPPTLPMLGESLPAPPPTQSHPPPQNMANLLERKPAPPMRPYLGPTSISLANPMMMGHSPRSSHPMMMYPFNSTLLQPHVMTPQQTAGPSSMTTTTPSQGRGDHKIHELAKPEARLPQQQQQSTRPVMNQVQQQRQSVVPLQQQQQPQPQPQMSQNQQMNTMHNMMMMMGRPMNEQQQQQFIRQMMAMQQGQPAYSMFQNQP